MKTVLLDLDAIETRSAAAEALGWTPPDPNLGTLLLTDIPALVAALKAVRALHKPFKIYTDDCCNSPGHESGDDDTIDIPEVGTVCEGGFMYEICRECCDDGDNGQSEDCASYHDHGKDKPICKTAELL